MIDIGLVGTEMVYFAVGHLDLDGGIQVTASHNPKEYTGMKIVRRGALPVGGDSGLLDIRDRAMAISDRAEGQTPGQVREEDVFPAYVDKVVSFVDLSAVKPLRSMWKPHRSDWKAFEGRTHRRSEAGSGIPAVQRLSSLPQTGRSC